MAWDRNRVSVLGSRESPAALKPFFDRIGRSGDASLEAQVMLAGCATPPRRHAKSERVVYEAQSMNMLSVLCDGLAISSRTLANGQQQNLAIFVPGDVLNHEEFLLRKAVVSVWALTPIIVVNIPHLGLGAVIEQHPSLGRALWREMAGSLRVAHEWMVSMGRRSAYQRVAHFLCEVQTRFRAAGLATAAECLFPLTQSELADTLGLSVVHINRVLQQLRREDLVYLAQGKLVVRDWKGLVRACDFDPRYLDLPQIA